MKPKVIVIVGPTASGKTSLSIALAKKFNGEVVSADSRQVYRGLDLGSGKVTKEEMDGIAHHLLDVADPTTIYTASDFKRDAALAVADILKRNRLPIIAGGTFLYVDALLGRTSLPSVPPNQTLRAELSTLSLGELVTRLNKLDPKRASAIDQKNPRRLIRAIEIASALGSVPETKQVEIYDTLTLGVAIDKETLDMNIHQRLFKRLEQGMVEEVLNLLKNGLTHERLDALGLEYRYLSRYLKGDIDYATMCTEIETKSRQFAKRQLTWLKRDPSIIWVDKNDLSTIYTLVQDFLTR